MYLSMSFSLRCNSRSHHVSSCGRSESNGSSAMGEIWPESVRLKRGFCERAFCLQHLDHNRSNVVELRCVLRELAHRAVKCVQDLTRRLFTVLTNDVERAFDAEERFIGRHRFFNAVREQHDDVTASQRHLHGAV